MSANRLRKWAIPISCECGQSHRIKTFELVNSGGKHVEVPDAEGKQFTGYLTCTDCHHTYELHFIRQNIDQVGVYAIMLTEVQS